MIGPFRRKGKNVFLDPRQLGALEMPPTDSSLVVPPDERPTINGEPFQDNSHEFVVKKDKNAQD
jgi:hypothetical protein